MSKKKKPIPRKRNRRKQSSRINKPYLDNYSENIYYVNDPTELLTNNLNEKAKKIVQIIKDYLNKIRIDYQEDRFGGDYLFHFLVESEDGFFYPFSITVETTFGNLGFVTSYLDISKKYAIPTYLLVNSLNDSIPYGTFCYIQEDDLITYNLHVPLLEENIKPEIFEFYFSLAMYVIESQLPAIVAASEGIFPQEQTDQLKKDINKLLKNITPVKKSDKK